MDVRGEQVDLTHGVEAPRASRRFLVGVLTRWGAPEALIERAQLLVSELVSNAFQYGHSNIRVLIESQRGSNAFRVEVCNTGHGHPVLRHPSANDISGRGLQIVEELSGAWGSTTSGGETSVWFEMRADASV